MFKTTPNWIKNLDNSSADKHLLLRLIKEDKQPISTPREMNFDIKDLRTLNEAENAAHQIKKRGWECVIRSDYRNNGMYWVESTKQNYVIDEHSLLDDQDFFLRTAMLYEATYDGWYAELL